jgi:predicted metalloendopeptidase
MMKMAKERLVDDDPDNREYNKRTKAIIALYNQAKVLGTSVSGKLTLNENISDLGGLAIALDALRMELQRIQAHSEEQKEGLSAFFYILCGQLEDQRKPEKVLQGLFLDKHAPAPLRVKSGCESV